MYFSIIIIIISIQLLERTGEHKHRRAAAQAVGTRESINRKWRNGTARLLQMTVNEEDFAHLPLARAYLLSILVRGPQ